MLLKGGAVALPRDRYAVNWPERGPIDFTPIAHHFHTICCVIGGNRAQSPRLDRFSRVYARCPKGAPMLCAPGRVACL